MSVLCFGSLNIDYVYQAPHFVNGGETLAAASLDRFSGGMDKIHAAVFL